ncbi:HAD family phosphatase [Geomonas sp. RF6]|uniref:HAD family hydrolase n=1 Tax=Geomonas sp. RF6 TaxID=2897342 RepID=UPI001E331FB9|nr:HAD family phosphatase [Geomonas sp. RF6]UFS69272.1 HAD family phosphatase [Geomonas sp. RF6]
MLKAVIFDFDGVIVDTEPLHYQAFQEILVPLGMGYSWQEYVEHYMGFDDRDAFKESFLSVGRELSQERLHELIDAKAAAFHRVVAGGVPPYAGVVELIRELSGTVPLGLCSGALLSDIEPILSQLGLQSSFDAMVTADQVAASKPDPESYRVTLARLQELFPENGVTPSETLAIEDTPAGILSATGAGAQVLAVTNSYPPDRLSGACKVVESLAGIDLRGLRLLL